MRYWQTKQWWLDSVWRAFRTFCQSLAGLLVAVQSSNQIAAMPEINIPWYGYLYSSGVAALISLCQSIDRERAVLSSGSADPVKPLTGEPISVGCGDQLR